MFMVKIRTLPFDRIFPDIPRDYSDTDTISPSLGFGNAKEIL